LQAGVTRARRGGSPLREAARGVAATESGGEQSAFGGVGGELQCLLVGLPGIVGAAEVAQKRRPGGVEEVVTTEPVGQASTWARAAAGPSV
jgi:hypothetical protein